MIFKTFNWNFLMHQLCGWSAVALLFAAPFSRSLYILSGLLFSISWFAQKDLRVKLKQIMAWPIAKPALAISIMVLLWATWSPAPFKEILANLKVYSKMLMLLMLASTLTDVKWRARAWWGLMLGMALVLGSTFANIFIDLPWSMTKNQGLGADHSVFVEYVSQSVMTSVFLAFTLQRLISSKNTKLMIFWACVSAMALFTILFLLSGRSGLIACTVVICVSAFLYIPKHRQWQSLFLILSALTLFVLISPLMLSRVQQAYNDIVNYQSFDVSSLGLRMDMWMLALKSFVQHPLFGTGVGTYPQIAASHFNTLTAAQLVFAVIHPHNQYLFFAMEYGLVGLLAFLWFMWQLLNTAYISEMPERNILFAVIAVIAVDSLYNVPLWYRAESYFFYAVLALLVASNQKSKDKQTI